MILERSSASPKRKKNKTRKQIKTHRGIPGREMVQVVYICNELVHPRCIRRAPAFKRAPRIGVFKILKRFDPSAQLWRNVVKKKRKGGRHQAASDTCEEIIMWQGACLRTGLVIFIYFLYRSIFRRRTVSIIPHTTRQ